MRSRILSIASLLVLFAAAGCKHGGNAAATPTPTEAKSQPAEEGTSSYEGSSASTGSSAGSGASGAEATPTPLALDEAHLKSWIAYRHELIAMLADERKKLAALSSKGDAEKIAGMTKISDETDKTTAELQKKYGFTKQQDDDIQNAANDVVGAMPLENPATAAALADLKKQAAQPGADGDGAREQLKTMQDEEKKSLDDARAKYGAAAVGVLIAHQPELAKLQADAMAAAFGK